LIRRTRGIEKEKKDRHRRKSHPDDRGNRALSGFVDRNWDVMEVCHPLETGRD